MRIDSQGYGRVRGSQNREDRKLAFDTFWSKRGSLFVCCLKPSAQLAKSIDAPATSPADIVKPSAHFTGSKGVG